MLTAAGADGTRVTTAEGLDGSRPPAPLAGRSAGVRRIEAVLLVMVLLGLAAWFGLPWYRDRSYAGTTASVVLEWHCIGVVVWRDPDRNVSWDSVKGEVSKAKLDALEGTTAGPYDLKRTHQARGTMKFTSYTDATFTSSTGATLRFVRHPEGQFYSLGCSIA